MNQTTRATYDLVDVPLDPVDPGTSLLVTGPSIGGTRELCLACLGHDADGVVVVSADLACADLVTEYERVVGGFDASRVGVVDCTQHGRAEDTEAVRSVGSPADLTGIGMHYSALYQQFGAGGLDRVRTGIYTLTTVLPFVDDMRTLYRFLHTLTGRIRSADGLGVCGLDPEAVDDAVVGSVSQAFDARIDLRPTDDGCEIRPRGLPDQAETWRAYEPPA